MDPRVVLWLIGGFVAASLAACSSVPSSSINSLHRSTVIVEHDRGHGSGFIIGESRVLTAYHVIQGDDMKVRFFDGQALAGDVVWVDRAQDLAIIDVAVPAGHPVASFSCEAPLPDQHLIAVGHPHESQWVAVGGYLPARDPRVEQSLSVGLPVGGYPADHQLSAENYLAMGFPIGVGTSGGPVFNESGEVVGITLAILASRMANAPAGEVYRDTGIGLMLPSSEFCADIEPDKTAG
jgi:putative serine protease PepD